LRVALTHGYFLHEDPKERKIMKPYPPLGILYISAYLQENGYANKVFDTTFSSKAEMQQRLADYEPDVIAIYTNLMTKLNVLEWMRFIHNHPQLKKARIILGGPDVTYNLENYLKGGADFIVVGEGEESMLELVANIESGNPFVDHIPGIAYMNAMGAVEQNTKRKHIKSVDELPMPNREAIDMQPYLATWKKHHGSSSITVSTQRGCPYTCKWCSTAVYGQSYRRRSPEKVADEFLYLKQAFAPDSVWVVDDTFTVSHRWLAAFTEVVNNKQAIIPYECISRADRMNDEVIDFLKKSGCYRVWIGAESGSQKIIDAMDRRVDVNHVQRIIQRANSAGLETGTFIMLGYPGETEEDIEATIHHLKVSNPTYFTITVAYPIAGTALHHDIQDIRTNVPDWFTSTDRDIDFKRTYPKHYYKHALRRVNNEVNYHKAAIASHPFNFMALYLKAKSLLGKAGMWWVRRFG